MVLSATNEANTIAIETMLETLFKELFNQTANSIETANSNPSSLKNQNEILRCFAQLGMPHTSKTTQMNGFFTFFCFVLPISENQQQPSGSVTNSCHSYYKNSSKTTKRLE
jgi:hypothetical protein